MTRSLFLPRLAIVAGATTAASALFQLASDLAGGFALFAPINIRALSAAALGVGIMLVPQPDRRRGAHLAALALAVIVIVASLFVDRGGAWGRPLAAVALGLVAVGHGIVIASAIAFALTLAGFAYVVGIAYGGTLVLRPGVVPAHPSAALALLAFGIAAVAACGPSALPTRWLRGSSVRALLLRYLLPLVVAVVVLTNVAAYYLFASVAPALGSAMSAFLSVIAAAAVIVYVSSIIAGRLDRMHARLAQAERLEAVGQLAGGVAHDFNNLLTVIVASTDLALQDVEPRSESAGHLRDVRDAARRAIGLTRQLLTFSGARRRQAGDVDVDTAIRNVQRVLERLVGDDISLVLRLEAGPGTVRTDAAQLEQVITNLVVNARDAMPNGGTITITTEPAEVGASFERNHADASPGRYVRLTVSDTGTGIPAEVLSRIFEPFFTTKETGRGTGLGLSTTQRIVQRSGGFITVDSFVGHGSTFSVYLPGQQ